MDNAKRLLSGFQWRRVIAFLVVLRLAVQVTASDTWSQDRQERPANMPSLQSLDVTCFKNHMKVMAEFNSKFHGTIFSKGSSGQEGCVYVAPRSGNMKFQFDIQYDRCGTKPDLNGKLYENTIVIQYGPDLIEVWDEAKRLRCEWFNDYQKTQAANPPVLIDELEEVQQEFVGDHVEVWMEIQEGKGPWASQVSGIVPLGSTLTLVVAINDPSNEFDMLVRSCVASDSVRQPLMLSDEYGCIMRPKMFGQFQKMRVQDARATVITYAHFQAFKFPDALQVQLQCRVMICRHSCPEHCQNTKNNVIKSRSDAYSVSSSGDVAVDSERMLTSNITAEALTAEKPQEVHHTSLVGPRNLRIRRDDSSDQEYGVVQTFQAISRSDLAFSPSPADGVSILAGHAAVDDGALCFTASRFALIIIIMVAAALLAIGVVLIILYRYCKLTSSKQKLNSSTK